MRRWGTAIRSALGCAGVLLLLVCWIFSLMDPWSPAADTDLSRRFDAHAVDSPWLEAPLGRDMHGRDLLRVLMHGTQAFVGPGLLAAAVGIGLGVGAALLRPLPGQYLPGEQSFAAATRALPSLGWMLLVAMATDARMPGLALTLGLLAAPDLAAEMRWRFGLLLDKGVLDGARAQGLRWSQLRWRWLVRWDALPLAARAGPRLIASLGVTEAALSYLGDFGVPEPTPSWGKLLRDLSPLLFRAEPGAPVWLAALLPVLFWAVVQALEASGETLHTYLTRPSRERSSRERGESAAGSETAACAVHRGRSAPARVLLEEMG